MLRIRTIAATLAFAVIACGPASSSSGPAPSTDATASSSPASSASAASGAPRFDIKEFDVPSGSHPHDVAPAVDGGVWYTGQHVGTLGHLDPVTGDIRQIDLGNG